LFRQGTSVLHYNHIGDSFAKENTRKPRNPRAQAPRIGPATLLRIESGRIPDLMTFGKICQWLPIDPAEFLGMEVSGLRAQSSQVVASAHMKVDQNPKPETIHALAQMILLAANAQTADPK
jgi:hypothetical protein